MPIPFACACGTKLKIADDLLGKKVRCPKCQKVAVAQLQAQPIGAVRDGQAASMTPARHQRIQQVLDHALDLPVEKRAGFLQAACAGDPDLRLRVDSLLRHERQMASAFMESPAIPDPQNAPTLTYDTPAGDKDTWRAEPRKGPEYPQTGDPSAPANVPGYEILEELGHGGMGVVYKARQIALGRVVALKMILAGGRASEEGLARFRTEAEAVARLQHPGIVQIHETGVHDGLPYFSLEYVAGGSLDRKLMGTPLPPASAARLTELLARAMEAAHKKHILHRDLKPANVFLMPTEEAGGVLIDTNPKPQGEVLRTLGVITPGSTRYLPKIGNFGLAKKLDEAGQTGSGAVMGTPSYMAPEQAAGKGKELGPAADVYALGAILYECLTGRPPFRAASSLETIMLVIHAEPVPPTQLNPKTPRDLETICLKCLQKGPGKRYVSARELAKDLKRFLKGEPIVARPVGAPERVFKWVKRRPAVAGLLATVVLTFVAGLAGILWQYGEAVAGRTDARTQEGIAKEKAQLAEKNAEIAKEKEQLAVKNEEDARLAEKDAKDKEREKDKQLTRAEGMLYASSINLAQRLWHQGKARAAWEMLDACRWDYRGWEHNFLFTLFNQNQQTLAIDGERVALSPDGQRIVSAGFDSVDVLDVHTGQLFFSLPKVGQTESVAFSPDGKRIASGGLSDNTVKVWDATTGRKILAFKGHTLDRHGVRSVAFSPDGKLLASASSDKTAKVWDATSGQETLTLKGHFDEVMSVAFSPDGKRLATGSYDRTLKVWDATTGQEIFTLHGAGQVLSVAFGPDGKSVIGGGTDKTVRIWDSRTGELNRTLLGHTDIVHSVAVSRDGGRIVSGSGDGMVKIWDSRTGHETLTLRGHTDTVRSVAFSPDGRHIVSSSRDRTVKVWDVQAGQGPLVVGGGTGGVWSVAFSPDNQRIVSASQNGTVQVWDAESGQHVVSFKGSGDGRIGGSIAFSPDGHRVVSGGSLGKIGDLKVFDVRSGQRLLDLKGHTSRVTSVAFSRDGKRIASGSNDKTLKVWDATSGEEILTIRGHTSEVTCVAFSPDGKRLASGCFNPWVKIWDAHWPRDPHAQGTHRLYQQRGVQSRRQTPSQLRYGQDGQGVGCQHR